MDLQLGLDTFGDIALGPDGQPLPAATVIREVLAEGQLADSLGIANGDQVTVRSRRGEITLPAAVVTTGSITVRAACGT